MDQSALRSFVGLSIFLLTRHVVRATPVIFNDSLEGSGQWESVILEVTPTPSNPSFINESVKSTSKPFLDQVVDFLHENHLPIIVISTLILLIITVLCSAAILSRRRKVSTYYPCAFPSKMYVDERDKTGGGHLFSEVPEKTIGSSCEEPVNSAKQLQEDIMLATKNLRTPVKTPWKEKNEPAKDQKSGEDEKQAQTIEVQEENCTLPEDKSTLDSAAEACGEKISSSSSQDSLSSCEMEKTDPEESGPPEESKHPSNAENLEIEEDKNKQEVGPSAFISQEKTAF